MRDWACLGLGLVEAAGADRDDGRRIPAYRADLPKVEDKAPPVVTDAIWWNQDPWAYPLEEMAQSYVLTYANETEER